MGHELSDVKAPFEDAAFGAGYYLSAGSLIKQLGKVRPYFKERDVSIIKSVSLLKYQAVNW